MKKILISILGIASVGFVAACDLNFTKAVAQTAVPGESTCSAQIICDPNGKPYTGEYNGRYYVMGIEQNKESYENQVSSTNSLLDEPFGESLDSSLNQTLEQPLDASLNQPIGETQDTDTLTSDDGSQTDAPEEL